MADIPLNTLLEFALDAAWQAGRITIGYFQTGVSVERKSDLSPVTRADREAEQKIRTMIDQHFPTCCVVGEEYGHMVGQTDMTWIIDPIDGTKSFVAGVPLYGCLIALTDGRTPVLGVAHFPALNETVYATRGGGCFWDGRRAHVSSKSTMNSAVVLGSTVVTNEAKQPAWERLCAAGGVKRTWGDAYGYSLVATGRAEVMCDAVMQVWDCAPFQVIMEEAGGTFTDWKGEPTIYAGESVATNGVLFETVMNLIADREQV